MTRSKRESVGGEAIRVLFSRPAPLAHFFPRRPHTFSADHHRVGNGILVVKPPPRRPRSLVRLENGSERQYNTAAPRRKNWKVSMGWRHRRGAERRWSWGIFLGSWLGGPSGCSPSLQAEGCIHVLYLYLLFSSIVSLQSLQHLSATPCLQSRRITSNERVSIPLRQSRLSLVVCASPTRPVSENVLCLRSPGSSSILRDKNREPG